MMVLERLGLPCHSYKTGRGKRDGRPRRRGADHSDDRNHGLWVDTGSLTSLRGSLGLLGLDEGRGRLLCLDDEGPDPLLGSGGGDDKAEPNGEDDPERDRGSRQPSWDSNSRVEASHPVRPLQVFSVAGVVVPVLLLSEGAIPLKQLL